MCQVITTTRRTKTTRKNPISVSKCVWMLQVGMELMIVFAELQKCEIKIQKIN